MDEEKLAELYPELYGEESPNEFMSIITAETIRDQTPTDKREEEFYSE